MLSKNELKDIAALKQKKFRDSENKFIIEGFHLLEECLSSSYHIEIIIQRSGTELGTTSYVNQIIRKKKIRIETINETQFNKISDTSNPQGIAAVVRKPKSSSSKPGDTVIALERINDPGNLGTILRTAYWFGIKSILLSGGSADVFNPKTLRASQGAVFHANVKESVNLLNELKELSYNGYSIYLLTPDAENSIGKLPLSRKAVYVFGNEAEGISLSLMDSGFTKLRIEGFSECESLNLAVSAGIVMYTAAKS